MKRIQVACCFDDAMAIPASVVAASTAAATTDAHVTFHMLHAPSLSIDMAGLKAALDSDRFCLVGRAITDDLSTFYRTKQYSQAMYYRYLLPRLLDADRVIYLDSDTMVRKSLLELHDTDLMGRPIAAARDYGMTFHMRDHGIPIRYRGRYLSVEEYCRQALDLDISTTPYFNSGVLVMDLDEWRRTNLADRLMDYCRDNPGLTMADQDAGNHILRGDFAELDTRWNSFTYLYREYLPSPGQKKTLIFGGYEKRIRPPSGEWLNILSKWMYEPWIVHFAYRSKPWEAHHRRTPYDDEYWAHAAHTPYLQQLRERYEVSKKQTLAEMLAQRFALPGVRSAVRRVHYLLRGR